MRVRATLQRLLRNYEPGDIPVRLHCSAPTVTPEETARLYAPKRKLTDAEIRYADGLRNLTTGEQASLHCALLRSVRLIEEQPDTFMPIAQLEEGGPIG